MYARWQVLSAPCKKTLETPFVSACSQRRRAAIPATTGILFSSCTRKLWSVKRKGDQLGWSGVGGGCFSLVGLWWASLLSAVWCAIIVLRCCFFCRRSCLLRSGSPLVVSCVFCLLVLRLLWFLLRLFVRCCCVLLRPVWLCLLSCGGCVWLLL